ncbi:MAG TPA: type I restriction endonuclease subunit R [Chloroflexia bacterium]|nr:type I restriction endonuclease subunit R [Chloroflexia bacterium]
MPSAYSEDALVEQPAIATFAALGWATVNAYAETFAPGGGSLGRETPAEVVLRPRLRAALARLNPALPATALALAEEELTRDRATLHPVRANEAVYGLLRDGVKVRYRTPEGEDAEDTVRVIDWATPAANDFLLAAQFWITGDLQRRRADLAGFVNGLPLVVAEFKAPHVHVKNAYSDNLRDYLTTIPQLFWYNAFVILSNGAQSRLGAAAAPWEHFVEWKRVAAESEPGQVALETLIRGTCDPPRLLDLLEHFILFGEDAGRRVKILGKNHQVLGVNNAVAAVRRLAENGGRLGVFWHTQGSGKSYSMVFFMRKVLRLLPGAWTFVVVTDRQDLDRQIYQTFAATGAVTEAEEAVRARNGEQLRRLLGEDHRVIFTLIQKFGDRPAAPYSPRANVIVLADEAHRSQYETLALHMRLALPHAAFLGFTGTPLLAGEARTREVFGDYVSTYDFQQSIADGATVPLYYENRIPELQLTNAELDADLAAVVEAADLDATQEQALEREFARQYHLITRDERLETIAADLVAHFLGRGIAGKAMVVAVDKATAVRMYDKVQRHWQAARADREARLAGAAGAARAALERELALLRTTEMAVVVSAAQNEVADLAAKGLDIRPHRARMQQEDLEAHFKDPTHPLRLVFVCAMWMTGFDAPSVATIYLDKPMRNHTLMQTIARANRVYGDKPSGLIVDYIGVFRNLQQALAIYSGAGAGGATPVQDKRALLATLTAALDALTAFCRTQGVDPAALQGPAGFALTGALAGAVDALVVTDAIRQRYLALTADALRLYRAILPDPQAAPLAGRVELFQELARQIVVQTDPPDISGVLGAVAQVLDASIAPTGYLIREPAGPYRAARGLDLAQIDVAALAQQFAAGQRHTAAQRLRAALDRRLQQMVRLNRTRTGYLARFQALIDAYNAGAQSVEWLFAELTALTQDLDSEAQRTVTEQLSEEELALFDLLTRPDVPLAPDERALVKQVAHDLLATLKREKLVLDWRTRQQARAAVRVAIQDALDGLPAAYTPALYDQKCTAVYEHVYEAYAGPDRSIYAA